MGVPVGETVTSVSRIKDDFTRYGQRSARCISVVALCTAAAKVVQPRPGFNRTRQLENSPPPSRDATGKTIG